MDQIGLFSLFEELAKPGNGQWKKLKRSDASVSRHTQILDSILVGLLGGKTQYTMLSFVVDVTKYGDAALNSTGYSVWEYTGQM